MSTSPTPSDMLKPAAIAGIVGGVLSSIPVINFLNCLFCLWIQLAGAGAVWLHLKDHEGSVSGGSAATIGAITGAIAGLVGGLLNLVLNAVLMEVLNEFMAQSGVDLPADVTGQMAAQSLVTVPIMMVLYAAFAALGGFLGLTFLSPDRRA